MHRFLEDALAMRVTERARLGLCCIFMHSLEQAQTKSMIRVVFAQCVAGYGTIPGSSSHSFMRPVSKNRSALALLPGIMLACLKGGQADSAPRKQRMRTCARSFTARAPTNTQAVTWCCQK